MPGSDPFSASMEGIPTQTRQQQALDTMAAFSGFQCPVCASSLYVTAASLRCQNGHTYDVARKGYVNLHHKTVKSAYDAALFSARRAVFDAGFYTPVLTALENALRPFSPAALLDAGCGEGYFLSGLSAVLPSSFLLGVDLSKEAILCASSRPGTALYCVGDLNHLPFQDKSFDAVLNILSPANYTSFRRILKKEGLLLKLMPGREYLQEIRVRLPLESTAYDDSLVPEYLGRQMQILRRERLHYTRPLSPGEYGHFISMTPLTQSLSSAQRQLLLANCPNAITIDLHLAVCANTFQP